MKRPPEQIRPSETNPLAQFADAVELVIKRKTATQKMLQEAMSITPQEAKRLLAQMEERDIIGPAPRNPREARKILVDSLPPSLRNGGEKPNEEADVEVIPFEHPVPAQDDTTEARSPTQEAEPARTTANEPENRRTSIRQGLRESYKRFVSKFKGEVQPEEEEGYEKSMNDYAKKGALALIGGYASVIGYKGFYDMPAWLVQKFMTEREKDRLRARIWQKEHDIEEDETLIQDQQMEAKNQMLSEIIHESKYLTKEKKQTVIAELQKIVKDYKEKATSLRKDRDEKIAKLLDRSIETRVKGLTALKEGVNTALMASGLLVARAAWFGAVSVMERYKEVMKDKKRREHYVREMTYRGFTETLGKLAGGIPAFAKIGVHGTGAGMEWVKATITKKQSEKLNKRLEKLKAEAPAALRAIDGAAKIMRFAGIGGMAAAELLETGGVSEAINAALDAIEHKGVMKTAFENITAAPMRPIESAQTLYRHFVSPEEAALMDTPPKIPMDEKETVKSAARTDLERPQTKGETTQEAAPAMESPEMPVEAETVKKGDSITSLLERQGIAKDEALAAARDAGMIRTGGDTRLTTEAIGKLGILAEHKPEGGIEIKFIDTENDKILTLEEAREAGLLYESGAPPGEIPTETEIAAHVPETVESIIKNSPDVPNDLLNNTFHIYTDEEGRFTNLDPGEGDTLPRMREALQELVNQGYGESAEARFIAEQYKLLFKNTDADQQALKALPEQYRQLIQEDLESGGVEIQDSSRAAGETQATSEATGEARDIHEPLRKFIGESGKVKFIYAKDGSVKEAFMPAYTPKSRDIKDALDEWGLTRDQVEQHFIEKRGGQWTPSGQGTHGHGWIEGTAHPGRYPGWPRPGFQDRSAQIEYREFVRGTERLSRQEALLREMGVEGLSRTPEYAHLKKETDQLEKFVQEQMKKEFRIKERPI